MDGHPGGSGPWTEPRLQADSPSHPVASRGARVSGRSGGSRVQRSCRTPHAIDAGCPGSHGAPSRRQARVARPTNGSSGRRVVLRTPAPDPRRSPPWRAPGSSASGRSERQRSSPAPPPVPHDLHRPPSPPVTPATRLTHGHRRPEPHRRRRLRPRRGRRPRGRWVPRRQTGPDLQPGGPAHRHQRTVRCGSAPRHRCPAGYAEYHWGELGISEEGVAHSLMAEQRIRYPRGAIRELRLDPDTTDRYDPVAATQNFCATPVGTSARRPSATTSSSASARPDVTQPAHGCAGPAPDSGAGLQRPGASSTP